MLRTDHKYFSVYLTYEHEPLLSVKNMLGYLCLAYQLFQEAVGFLRAKKKRVSKKRYYSRMITRPIFFGLI